MSCPDQSPGAPRTKICLREVVVLALLAGLPPLTALPVSAQDDPSGRPTAEALILREKTRVAVAEAFDLFRRPAPDGAAFVAKGLVASDRMVEIGPEAVPYLANEMEQARPDTYYFCAFSLGRIGGEPSLVALREAIERAEVESGDFAIYRKAWAAHALAIGGEAEALDRFNRGVHVSADVMMHRETTALESAALQIAPEIAAPILLGQLERYRGDERMNGQRTWALRALRRVADTAAVPAVVALLDDPEQFSLRSEAARALAGMPSEAAIDGLVRAIADEDFRLRRTVALALEYVSPPSALPAIRRQLESEEDTVIRSFFYQTLANAGDPAERSWIDTYRGREDPSDRRGLVRAVAALGPARADLLRDTLADDDLGVMIEAASALARLGDEASENALATALRTVEIDRLGPLSRVALPVGGPVTFAAAIERLASPELREAARAAATREMAGWMIDALLERGALGVSATLSEWREQAKDPYLLKRLDRVLPLFKELDRHGTATGPWFKTFREGGRDQRRVALARLASNGSAKAARAIAAAFDREDLELGERIELVDALATIGRLPQAAPVLERLLLDPAHDGHEQRPLRDAAAWAARRLGGAAMIELLSSAIIRRGGREFEPIVYLSLLDPSRGAAAITRYRTERMVAFGRRLGDEQLALDRLRREIADGQSLWRWDLRPERLPIR